MHRALLIFLCLIPLLLNSPVSARPSLLPPCGPYQDAGFDHNTNNYAFCHPRFDTEGGIYLRIASNVPFIWLRTNGSSDAPINGVVYPNQAGIYVSPRSLAAWDGYQWWWYGSAYPGEESGWVEQASLTTEMKNGFFTDPSPAPDPEQGISPLPIQARLRATIPWAWLRTFPAIDSPVQMTIQTGQTFSVHQWPHRVSDGHQYWYPVRIGDSMGWLEQGAIDPQ